MDETPGNLGRKLIVNYGGGVDSTAILVELARLGGLTRSSSPTSATKHPGPTSTSTTSTAGSRASGSRP